MAGNSSRGSEADRQLARMTTTPIPPLIVRLAIPSIISMLVTTLYNTADTWFVSQLGTGQSAGVGVFMPVMAIIQALGFMLGQGAGSHIARLLGQQQIEAARMKASSAVFAALVTGLGITVAGILMLDPLLRLVGAGEDFLVHAREYAFWILLVAPIKCASFVLNNLLRYEGKTFHAMVGLTTGGLINIALDPLFIFVFGWGVSGAAIATALSAVISFVILLAMLQSRHSALRLSPRAISRKAGDYIEMVRLGFPSLTRQGLASIAISLQNSSAEALGGAAAVAAFSIVGRVTFFVTALMLGLGQGFQPVVGYNYGARAWSRVRAAYRFTIITGFLLQAGMGLLLFLFAPQVVQAFRDDPAVIAVGIPIMQLQTAILPLMAPNTATNMLLQASGHAYSATLLAASRQGLFFIPLMLVLPRLFGLNGVIAVQPIADLLTLAITIPFALRFFRNLPQADGIAYG